MSQYHVSAGQGGCGDGFYDERQSLRSPRNVSTNYIYTRGIAKECFSDMPREGLLHYSGSVRAVRRDGLVESKHEGK